MSFLFIVLETVTSKHSINKKEVCTGGNGKKLPKPPTRTLYHLILLKVLFGRYYNSYFTDEELRPRKAKQCQHLPVGEKWTRGQRGKCHQVVWVPTRGLPALVSHDALSHSSWAPDQSGHMVITH